MTNNSRTLWVLLPVIAVAALLRVAAARDELWLDEIWSLVAFAGTAPGPLQILQFHHDNNHQLLTAWMWAVGPNASSIVYRLPSIAAGTCTLILAWRFAQRWGDFAALAAAALMGSSFVMITYSSEARGYALAGLFTLTAFLAAEQFLTTKSVAACAVLAGSVVFGTWSHLTFILFYAALAAWSIERARRTIPSIRHGSAALAYLHILPMAFLVAWYLFDVRRMEIGSGDDYVMSEVLLRTSALAVGVFSGSMVFTVMAALVAVSAATAGIFLLYRADSDLWVLFASLFLAPALLLIDRPEALYERYFVIPILWAGLLYSYLLSRAWSHSYPTAVVAILALCVLVLTNGRAVCDLLRVGRGQFGQALAFMVEHSGPEVQLVGDVKMRMVIYLAYWIPREGAGHRFALTELIDRQPVSQWVVLTDQGPGYEPPVAFPGYRLTRVFPHAGLSGFHFAVYESDQFATKPLPEY